MNSNPDPYPEQAARRNALREGMSFETSRLNTSGVNISGQNHSRSNTMRAHPSGAFKVLQFIAVLGIATWTTIQAQAILIPLCLAALLAFSLAPGVRFLRRHKTPEAIALLLVACLFFIPLIITLTVTLVQGEGLATRLPTLINTLKNQLESIIASSWGNRLHLDKMIHVSAWTEKVTLYSDVGMKTALEGLQVLFTASGKIVLVLIFALLMLASRTRLQRWSEQMLRRGVFSGGDRLTDLATHPRAFVESIAELIQRFLLVRLAMVVFVAGVDWLILSIFGLPYAFFAAVFLGLSELVPMVGFAFGLLPPAIIAIAVSMPFPNAVAMMLLLFTVSMVEGNILTPKLLGRQLDLNLPVSFLGIFLGGSLWGAWGIFLSIPILGITRIILATSPKHLGGDTWIPLMSEKDSVVAPTLSDKESKPIQLSQ